MLIRVVRIIAEVQAILKIVSTLLGTVDAVKSRTFILVTFLTLQTCHADSTIEATLFLDSEKAVIAALIAAIAAAASASIEPAATLSAGLSATGVTGINDVVQSLQGAVASLQAAAKINWSTS